MLSPFDVSKTISQYMSRNTQLQKEYYETNVPERMVRMQICVFADVCTL